MIVSHAHRFIFFAVPKTATHAVREALRTHMKEGDWEQQVLFGQDASPIPEIAQLKHGHITVEQIKPFIEDQQWQDYTKFAFVRHPFDRFVSACAFLNRQNKDYQTNETRWMKLALLRRVFRERLLIRPQAHQLCDQHGLVALDFVGRYESLQSSIDSLFDILGLPKIDLQRRNSSKHGAYQEYLDAELTASLASFYKDDFELFNYSVE